MNPIHSRQSRAERLIAASRAVLAVFSLFAIWLDPSEPTRYPATAYGLLVGYVVYAVGLAAFLAGARVLHGMLAVTTHCVDLAVAALVLFFTEGSTSPFFTYFVFALVAATLRWQWRGALWTGAAALTAFVALGIHSGAVAPDPRFELNRSVIRGAYLVVIALLLGSMGRHEEKLRGELTSLAAWPRGVPARLDEALGEALAAASATLKAPRLALAWEDPEEPWLYLALWSPAGLALGRDPPGELTPLVAEALVRDDFLCADASRQPADVIFRSGRGLSRWRGDPLNPGLLSRLRARTVLALALAGETFEGRLFALDKEGLTLDDLTLGRVTARQLAACLEQARLLDRLRSAAAAEERVRLARDLHDGVVQSLAAAGLQLQAAQSEVTRDPDGARTRIRKVQELLVEEQRSLRAIAGSLKPSSGTPPPPEPDLKMRLGELSERIQRHWGLSVKVCSQGELGVVSGSLAREACHLVHEALVNAARHGDASTARVELSLGASELRITVTDDGRGFEFRGTYGSEELAARRLGPFALRERVRSLRGSLRVDSAETGATIDMTLPLGGEGD